MALFKIFRGDKADLPGGWDEENEVVQDTTKLHDGYAYFCADTGELFIDADLSTDGSGLKRIQVNALAAKKLSDGTTTIEIDDIVLKTEPLVRYNAAGGATLTLNAVLVGNGTDTVKLIPADLGAFYVEDTTEGPKFGVLPVAQGGIGAATLTQGGILQGNGTNAVSAITGTGVLYAATDGAPQFGVAPISVGGTGGNTKADARNNLEVYSKTEIDTNATTKAFATTLTVAGWQADGEGFMQEWKETTLQCGKNHDVPPEVTFTSNREEYNKIDYATAESGKGIKFYTSKKPAEDIGIIIIDQL